MSFGILQKRKNKKKKNKREKKKNGILLEVKPFPIEVAQKIDDFISLNQNERKTKRRAAFESWNDNYSAKQITMNLLIKFLIFNTLIIIG